MEIRESREGDVLVLAPDSSIAGSEDTNAIETKLATSLKANFRQLVIDCSAIGQMTSAAIRVLLLTSRKLDRTDGRLVLFGMNAKLAKAFSISGFDKDFTVVATREEAVRRVFEPAPRRPARKEKAPAPSSAVSPPAAGPETPLVVLTETPPAPIEQTRPVVDVAPTPVVMVAPAESSSEADRREAIASALLEAVGVRVSRPGAARSSVAASLDLDALASGLLEALRVGRA